MTILINASVNEIFYEKILTVSIACVAAETSIQGFPLHLICSSGGNTWHEQISQLNFVFFQSFQCSPAVKDPKHRVHGWSLNKSNYRGQPVRIDRWACWQQFISWTLLQHHQSHRHQCYHFVSYFIVLPLLFKYTAPTGTKEKHKATQSTAFVCTRVALCRRAFLSGWHSCPLLCCNEVYEMYLEQIIWLFLGFHLTFQGAIFPWGAN